MDPENIAFVWNGRINLRFVDRALTDQKDITWFEMVSFSLDVIGDFSGKKDDDFVKIMIMIRKFPVCAVIDMKETELFFEITCFF